MCALSLFVVIVSLPSLTLSFINVSLTLFRSLSHTLTLSLSLCPPLYVIVFVFPSLVS